jgi:hypothetical protein
VRGAEFELVSARHPSDCSDDFDCHHADGDDVFQQIDDPLLVVGKPVGMAARDRSLDWLERLYYAASAVSIYVAAIER